MCVTRHFLIHPPPSSSFHVYNGLTSPGSLSRWLEITLRLDIYSPYPTERLHHFFPFLENITGSEPLFDDVSVTKRKALKIYSQCSAFWFWYTACFFFLSLLFSSALEKNKSMLFYGNIEWATVQASLSLKELKEKKKVGNVCEFRFIFYLFIYFLFCCAQKKSQPVGNAWLNGSHGQLLGCCGFSGWAANCGFRSRSAPDESLASDGLLLLPSSELLVLQSAM